jgi:hypothetical protein
MNCYRNFSAPVSDFQKYIDTKPDCDQNVINRFSYVELLCEVYPMWAGVKMFPDLSVTI